MTTKTTDKTSPKSSSAKLTAAEKRAAAKAKRDAANASAAKAALTAAASVNADVAKAEAEANAASNAEAKHPSASKLARAYGSLPRDAQQEVERALFVQALPNVLTAEMRGTLVRDAFRKRDNADISDTFPTLAAALPAARGASTGGHGLDGFRAALDVAHAAGKDGATLEAMAQAFLTISGASGERDIAWASKRVLAYLGAARRRNPAFSCEPTVRYVLTSPVGAAFVVASATGAEATDA